MSEGIASTVTATSVMLGAYGFFYGALSGRIESGLDVGRAGGNPTERAKQRRQVRTAKNTALLLGLVPLILWLIFLKPAINEIEAAFAADFSFHHYSPLDIVFVLLAFAWLPIAYIPLRQFKELRSKEKGLPVN